MTYATTTFGPILWIAGHLFAANYSEKSEPDKRDFTLDHFNRTFAKSLPCSWCRFYYLEICQLMPLEAFIDKPDGVSWWFYNVHDLVNKKIQFRERLCMERCVCTEEHCRYDIKTTKSSPPFKEVLALYNGAKMTKPLP